MERRAIKIDGFIGLYEVTEDGQVFSVRKQRFLKPSFGNIYGYVHYFLTPALGLNRRDIAKRSFSSHRLVAMHFIGKPPSVYHTDCHHKDHDKRNNHWSNLEWVTHSENILKSWSKDREHPRVSPWLGVKRGPHAPETIALMRAAKEKDVFVEVDGVRTEYGSIQNMVDNLGIYRNAFTRSRRSGKPYKGMTFGYVELPETVKSCQ